MYFTYTRVTHILIATLVLVHPTIRGSADGTGGPAISERLNAPKSSTLRTLFWRSEILQVMYWLHGEGLGDLVEPTTIERFLGVDAQHAVDYLDRLVDEGVLEREEGSYRLSPEGREEGSLEFEAAFAELTGPAHGECSPDCWCHLSVEEAEACAEERAGQHHPND